MTAMLTEHDQNLIAMGLARVYRGRLIPIQKGGDGRDEPADEPLYAEVPEDLSALTDEELSSLIEGYSSTIREVGASPTEFITAEVNFEALFQATQEALETLKELREHQASRTETAEVDPVELTDEQQAAIQSLAAASEDDDADDADGDDTDTDADADGEAAADTVVAAAAPKKKNPKLPKPSRERQVVEHAPQMNPVPVLAAGGAPDMQPGQQFTSELQIAETMIRRHSSFGDSGPGTVEKFSIARANWADRYPADRHLNKADVEGNLGLISKVVNPADIQRAFADRVHEQDKGAALVASGGLCAPVTPYYGLQYISTPMRPVQAGLPSFNADRGGLRYARPATLASVSASGATGIITEANDALGGTSATKTCQVIHCPPFQETDVDTIYHCLQFGNLGARAFPELVAQWNNLTLAAHSRLADSNLLTLIDAFSTQVTAGNLGLGASATIFNQVIVAAAGMRSRHRMQPDAVLRLMLPYWAVDLIVSDVIRTQFQRFDTDQARVLALFRQFNIEPSFYIDGASGRNQVFGAQAHGGLLPFPPTVVWYLFPEGTFLYLDTGVLELGIVRDSVLNLTNDFQIFGETFESVAFVGVESLAVESRVCDSGTVSLPATVHCPIDYQLS